MRGTKQPPPTPLCRGLGAVRGPSRQVTTLDGDNGRMVSGRPGTRRGGYGLYQYLDIFRVTTSSDGKQPVPLPLGRTFQVDGSY